LIGEERLLCLPARYVCGQLLRARRQPLEGGPG
jgi:hypothetical protein